MTERPKWMHHHVDLIGPARVLVACLIVLAASASSPQHEVIASTTQGGTSFIRVAKKQCIGANAFPVFLESHCIDVPDAVFDLRDPRNIHPEMLSAGAPYVPDDWYFAGSHLWSLTDVSANSSEQGIDVVSCLASEFRSDWRASVPRVVQTGTSESVSIDWMPRSTGVTGQTYQPSLDCIWIELPDLNEMPAVLSLHAFLAPSPHLASTSVAEPKLPAMPRGDSGEDIEANMVMSNVNTGDVYSFAADAAGQVLVPRGTYSLLESSSGTEIYFSMEAGQTTLVEVGLAAPSESGDVPLPDTKTRTFSTGALYCEGQTCSPLGGVTIYYESMDGTLSGSCVTEVQATPNGNGSWCDYPFIEGVPTVLTLDTSTLPAGMVVTSDNPRTYLVPEHPDGPLGPVTFLVGPDWKD